MRRKISCVILVVFLMFTALITTSCSKSASGNLYIHYNSETLPYTGYAAVVGAGRIYYVSNELGPQGIYSMEQDGSGVRLETANPSIEGIEIINGELYFIGLDYIADSQASIQTSTVNNHIIYRYDFYEDTVETGYSLIYDNTNGFFISPGGYTVVNNGAGMWRLDFFNDAGTETFDTIDNEIATVAFQYTGEKFSTKENKLAIVEQEIRKSIYQFGDLMIIGSEIPDAKGYDYMDNSAKPCVLDMNTGALALAMTSHYDDALKAFLMDEQYIYCAYKKMFVLIDRETFEVEETLVPEALSDIYEIVYIAKFGDRLYLLMNEAENRDRDYQPQLIDKFIILDLNTFKCENILDMNARERFIRIEEDQIILLDDGVIYRWLMDDGVLGDKEKIADAPSDIYTSDYMIEYAGGWMFIYKLFNEHKGSEYPFGALGQQLKMKVNLESGEVIYNQVELDFSVLESYQEE